MSVVQRFGTEWIDEISEWMENLGVAPEVFLRNVGCPVDEVFTFGVVIVHE